MITAILTASQPVEAQPQVATRPWQAAADLNAQYRRLSAKYAEDAARGWRPARLESGSLVFVAPDQYAAAARQSDSISDDRRTHADALFELAQEAAAAGQLSLAFGWATEAVRENPDHADARRVLGYEQHDGQWLTSYAARMSRTGKTRHPQFGWIAAEDVDRYEAGERLVGRRWISAEEDAARHERIEDGWRIRTDHFQVTSNHSLPAAVELAARLERLHQVWRQLFAGFYLSEREVKQLFVGERQARKRNRPFRVFYHRDKEGYVAALGRRQPRIAETIGIYFDAQREAHFFAGDEADIGTLYHEAVHQLFQETRTAARHVGDRANFWIVEGVATYFETLTEHRDERAGLYFTIGQSSAGRLPAARQRMLVGGYYVPLAELTRVGKDELQRYPDLAKLYSQATGLAAFLMDGREGCYREPLVRYLTAVYAGRDDAKTLQTVTGHDYAELDGQYRDFLESLP